MQHFIGNFPFQVFHSGRFVSNNLTLQHKPQEEAQVMYLQSVVFIEKVLYGIKLIYTGTARSHCIYIYIYIKYVIVRFSDEDPSLCTFKPLCLFSSLAFNPLSQGDCYEYMKLKDSVFSRNALTCFVAFVE